MKIIRCRPNLLRVAGTLLTCTAVIYSMVPSPVMAGTNDLIIEGTKQCTDILDYSLPAFHAQYSAYNVQVTVPDPSPTTTALNDVKAGGIDIAAAARSLSITGTDDPSHILTDKIIGREVICMIVNPQSNLSSLNYYQIRGIYNGTITDWSQLGGQALSPRSRNIDSGLWQTFCSTNWFAGVTDAEEGAVITATGLPRINSDRDMINAITANPTQIGYVGMGSLLRANLPEGANVKVLWLCTGSGTNYVAPIRQNVFSGAYPEGRGLHLWYQTANTKQAVADFNAYMTSKAGQDKVEQFGGIRIRPQEDINGDGNINIGDVVAIGLKWGNTGGNGWIKEDVNGDGYINIGDVVSVGLWWGYAYTITV